MNQEVSDTDLIARIQEMYTILKAWILKTPAEAEPHLKKAYAMRDNLQAMGYLVEIQTGIGFDPKEPGNIYPLVEITLWKPKKNMTPEAAKIYDAWMAKKRTNTSKGGASGTSS